MAMELIISRICSSSFFILFVAIQACKRTRPNGQKIEPMESEAEPEAIFL